MKKKLLFSFLAFPLVFLFACSTSNDAVSVTPNTSSSETHEHDESSESHSDFDVHVHTYVHHDKVDATCEEDGNIEYYTCSECGKYFDADKNEIAGTSIKINALGHDWGNWAVTTSPTHLVPGVETRVCNHDHSHTETRAVPITGHNFEFTEFRWSDNNTKAKAVLVCPDDNEEFLVDASMSHRDTATCTEDGYIEYRAEYNTHWATKNSTFSARKGHLAAAPVEDLATKKAATCTSDGGYEKVVYCSVCGEELSREIVVNAACGHNWGTEDDWIIDEEPSCNHAGSKHRVCKNDPNDIQYQVIPATGHNFQVTVVPPECETQGYTLHTCTNEDCDYSYKDNYLPALGHRDSHGVIHPSCTTDIHCEYCDAVIEHIGHDYQPDSETPATCTTAGHTHYVCANCGDSYNLQTFAPLGHHFDDDHCVDEQDTNYAYSCYHRKTYTCTREACEEHKYEYYVNHTYVYRADLSTEATCQQAGDKVYVCSVCNDVKHVQEGEPNPNNHVWVLGTEVVDGVRTDHCSLCNAERQVTVVSGNTNANSLKNKEISVENASSVKFDNSVIDTIANGNDDTEINLTVNEMNKGELGLTLDQLNQIGEKNKVYNFNLTKKVNDDVDTVSNFDGYITITLEYELQPGDDPDNIAVWYIDNTATLPQDRIKSYQATYSNGYVTFRTNHFSYYAVTTLTNEERCATYGHTWEYTHVDGDCTHGAYDIAVCSVCGSQEISNQEAPLGHDWHETHRTDATCSSSGQIDFECSRCHDTKQELIPTLGHDWELVEHVDPTCDDNGSDRYVCRTCGQSKVVVINSLGHTFNTEHVDATCEEKGYDHHVCTRCGDFYDDNYDVEDPHHDYVQHIISEQTCTESLIIEYRCENDPSHVYYEVTPATGHTPADTAIILNVVPATCTEDGSHDEVIYCTVCGEEISRSHHIDSALGHQEAAMVVENEVEATCEADGHHDEVVYCSTCHEELSRDTVTDAALGHSYGGWVGVSEPTCTEDGEEIRYCEHDHNHTETRPIAATGHTPGEVQIENVDPATCTEAGSHDEVIYCVTPGCGAELSRQHVTDEAKGHNWSPWVNMSDHATCTEDRQQSRQCQDCGIIEYRTAEAATGHNLLTRIKEGTETGSTCTEHGHYTLETYCAACGEVFSEYDEVVEKELLPHTPGEMHYDNVVPATCTSNGSHDEVYKCSVCEGEAYRVSGVVDEATGHHFGEWKEVTPATCTSDGLERRTCSDCGLTEDRVIPAHGHDTFEIPYTDPTRSLAPTCTKNGYNYVYDRCRYCEEELNGHTEVVPALGHDYYLNLDLTTFSSDRSTCTMVLVCRNNEEHKVTRTVNTTPDKELSCGVSHEVVTYTAELKYNGKTYTATSQLNNVSLPHTLEEPVIENVVPATCTEDGSYDEVTYCSECGQEVSRIDHSIPCLGHTPGEAVIENDVASTCDEQGHYDEVVYCSVCNAEISRETKYHEYFWHDYSIEQIIKEPTCTEKGIKRVICSHDPSHYNDEEIPALGHKTSAYCTYDENGHFHYCTVCGAEIEGTRQAHDYYIDSKPKTCTEDGYRREVCRICGYVSTSSYEIIPASHSGIGYDWKVERTCTQDGLYDLYCPECGDIIEHDVVVPALGHDFDASGRCQRWGCGQYDKETVRRQLLLVLPEGWGEHTHISSRSTILGETKAERDAYIYAYTNDNNYEVARYFLPVKYDMITITNVETGATTGEFDILSLLDSIECKSLYYIVVLDPNNDGDFSDLTVQEFNFEGISYYSHTCDYSYITNITLNGETCDDGYHIYKECICENSQEYDSTYHHWNYNQSFDLSPYGYNGSFNITYCDYCEHAYFNPQDFLNCFDESVISVEVEEEALGTQYEEHDLYRSVYVINKGEENELTLESIYYYQDAYLSCLVNRISTNTLYYGEEKIINGYTGGWASLGEHSYQVGDVHYYNDVDCSSGGYAEYNCVNDGCEHHQTHYFNDHEYDHKVVNVTDNEQNLLFSVEYDACKHCPNINGNDIILNLNGREFSKLTEEQALAYNEAYHQGKIVEISGSNAKLVWLYNSTVVDLENCIYNEDVLLLIYDDNGELLDSITFRLENVTRHDFGEWETVTAATCTTDGKEQRVCSRDEAHVEERIIPATGHNFVDGICTVCGHAYEDDNINVYFDLRYGWEINDITLLVYQGDNVIEQRTFTEEDIVTNYNQSYRYIKVVINTNDVTGLWLTTTGNRFEKVDITYSTPNTYVRCTGSAWWVDGVLEEYVEVLPSYGNIHLEVREEREVISNPTCTEYGETHVNLYCKECGEYLGYNTEYPSPLGHTHSSEHIDEESWVHATCTSDGEYKLIYHCDVCDSDYEFYWVTDPATGHTPTAAVRENEVATSCDHVGGYDEVVYCSVCHVELSREHHTIDMVPHTPGSVQIEAGKKPNYYEAGYHYEVTYCTVCGAELSRTQVTDPMLVDQETVTIGYLEDYSQAVITVEHSNKDLETDTYYAEVSAVESEHSCEDAYTITYNASYEYKGVTYNADEVVVNKSATGHSYGGWVGVSEPTCTEDGEEIRYCEHDHNHYETRPIPASGHTPGDAVRENVVPASCTTAGSYDEVVYCTVCHTELSRKTIPVSAYGHRGDEPATEKYVAPTCTEAGSYDSVIYCGTCHIELSRETIELEALGHLWSEWSVVGDATCTEARTETRTCSRCGETETRELEPASGHSFATVHQNVTPATCTEDGQHDEVSVCSVCGYVDESTRVTITDKATGHKAGETITYDVIEQTCTEPGSHKEKVLCEYCGELLSDEAFVDPALGHNFGYVKVTYHPEYNQLSANADCARCNKHFEETVEVSRVETIQEATETQPGIYKYYGNFTHFGEQSVKYETEPLIHEHNFNTYVSTTPSTCTVQGYKLYKCEFCDETEKQYLPLVEHQYGENQEVEATCTKPGYVYHTCTVCNKLEVVSNTEALGHDYSDVKYTWIENGEGGYSNVHASATCSRCNNTIEEDSYNIYFNVTVTPTENKDGEGTYTANFKSLPNATKTVVIPHKECEHSYETFQYNSYDDEKNLVMRLTVERCVNCGQVVDYHIGFGPAYREYAISTSLTEEQVKAIDSNYDQGQTYTFSNSQTAYLGIWRIERHDACTYDDINHVLFYDNNGKVMVDFDCTFENVEEHDWGEWTNVKEPTCGAEGTRQRVCNNDRNHVETESIPATGEHTYGEDHICTVCGARSFVGYDKNIYVLDATMGQEADLFVFGYNSNSGDINQDFPGYNLTNKDCVGTYEQDTPNGKYSYKIYKYVLGENFDSLMFVYYDSYGGTVQTQTPPQILENINKEIEYENCYLFVIGNSGSETNVYEVTNNLSTYLTNPHTHTHGDPVSQPGFIGNCEYEAGHIETTYCEECHELLSHEFVSEGETPTGHDYSLVHINFEEIGFCKGTHMSALYCEKCKQTIVNPKYIGETPVICEDFMNSDAFSEGPNYDTDGDGINDAIKVVCSKCHGYMITTFDSMEPTYINTCVALMEAHYAFYNSTDQLVASFTMLEDNERHHYITRYHQHQGLVITYTECLDCGDVSNVNVSGPGKEIPNTVPGEIIGNKQNVVMTTTYEGSPYSVVRNMDVTYLSECYMTAKINIKVYDGETVIFERNYTSADENHNMVTTYILNDKEIGCSGGWTSVVACSRCGYEDYHSTGTGHVGKVKNYTLMSDDGNTPLIHFEYRECEICHQVYEMLEGQPFDPEMFVMVGEPTQSGDYYVADYVYEKENITFRAYQGNTVKDGCITTISGKYEIYRGEELDFALSFVDETENHNKATRVIGDCETGSYVETYCTECGMIFDRSETHYGHDYEMMMLELYTDDKDGYVSIKAQVCRNCGEAQFEEPYNNLPPECVVVSEPYTDEQGYEVKVITYNVNATDKVIYTLGIKEETECITNIYKALTVIKDGEKIQDINSNDHQENHHFVEDEDKGIRYVDKEKPSCRGGYYVTYVCSACDKTVERIIKDHRYVNDVCRYCGERIDNTGTYAPEYHVDLKNFLDGSKKIYMVAASYQDDSYYIKEVPLNATTIRIPRDDLRYIRFYRMNEGITNFDLNNVDASTAERYSYIFDQYGLDTELYFQREGESSNYWLDYKEYGVCYHDITKTEATLLDPNKGCEGGVRYDCICEECGQTVSSNTQYYHNHHERTLYSEVNSEGEYIYNFYINECEICKKEFGVGFTYMEDEFEYVDTPPVYDEENEVYHNFFVKESKDHRVRYCQESYRVPSENPCYEEAHEIYTLTVDGVKHDPIEYINLVPNHQHLTSEYSLLDEELGCLGGYLVEQHCTCGYENSYETSETYHSTGKYHDTIAILDGEENEIFHFEIQICDFCQEKVDIYCDYFQSHYSESITEEEASVIIPKEKVVATGTLYRDTVLGIEFYSDCEAYVYSDDLQEHQRYRVIYDKVVRDNVVLAEATRYQIEYYYD